MKPSYRIILQIIVDNLQYTLAAAWLSFIVIAFLKICIIIIKPECISNNI